MKLTILGASGHGKVIADIARLRGYDEMEFLDDNQSLTSCCNIPVTGTLQKAKEIRNDLFIAIGNTDLRRELMETFSEKHFPVLCHPNAVIGEDVRIGAGTAIMAGTVINACVDIGKGVIINTSSSVDHDCMIHDYVHIAVGAHVCGNVEIGEGTWIGAGSTISNNVTICPHCMIGAGAVVVKDIDIPGTYIGVPARRKE